MQRVEFEASILKPEPLFKTPDPHFSHFLHQALTWMCSDPSHWAYPWFFLLNFIWKTNMIILPFAQLESLVFLCSLLLLPIVPYQPATGPSDKALQSVFLSICSVNPWAVPATYLWPLCVHSPCCTSPLRLLPVISPNHASDHLKSCFQPFKLFHGSLSPTPYPLAEHKFLFNLFLNHSGKSKMIVPVLMKLHPWVMLFKNCK